jgi:hypothetical protein
MLSELRVWVITSVASAIWITLVLVGIVTGTG